MVVHLELHARPCGTLRVYDAGNFECGDDYRLSLTAEISGTTVILHGADKPLSLADYKSIGRHLAGLGYERAEIKRNGRWKEINLTRFNKPGANIMATHTHYVKITMEVGNVSDTEAHQEVTLLQRTESSAENTKIQQMVTKLLSEGFIDLGAAKSG